MEPPSGHRPDLIIGPGLSGPSPSRGADPPECECPVCREPLFEALVSPCGHALCRDCAGSLGAGSPAEEPDIRDFLREREAPVPRCPVCRAAVGPYQYTRCYLLEQIAQSAHPEQWREAQRKTGEAKAPLPKGIAGIKELAMWKAIHEEQVANSAMKLIWAAVSRRLGDSTALLVGGPAPEPANLPTLVRNFGGPEPPPDSPRKRLSALLGAEWGVVPELQRRLGAEGLALSAFRLDGANAALITWPALPSAFAGLAAGDAP